ncbi:protocadherin Fat 4-like [Glandiceps talaboti]
MIHVLVINVNEAPGTPMWNQNTVSENANVGDVVAQLTATDPDHGQILNYTLITNAGGKFSISGTALIVNRPLDYETSSSHQVHIQVRDNGSPILTNSAVFEITVLDENEPPTKITFLGADVKEYKIGGDTVMGTVIGRFQTEDPDQGDTHVYSILNNDNCFNVQGQNLVVNSVGCFDYEANAFYLLDIETMDSGGLTTRTTIRVGLVDVNEPPTGIVLSTSSVMEHADLDTVVGTLTAIDPDAGDTHVFTLVSSSGPFLIDGHSIKVRADMSYEIYQSGISFDVQCTDSAGNSVVKTITVTLQDKNEPPNDITVTILKPCGPGHTGPDNFGIDACITETTVPGDIVAVVHATDPDADDLLTFTMIDASERFIFTNDHQIILGSDGVNYESVSYGHINQITIIATDLSGLTSEKDVTFEITDANDIPSDVRVSAHIVNSATPEGQNFASLTCLDEDLSDTHTFTLLDDSGGRFAVQGNHLQVAQALSVTFTHTRSIIVRCSDNKGAQTGDIQIDLQVTASEGNEDIDIILHDHIIAENSPINTVVGQLSASSSSNPGDTFTFDLMSSGEGTFVLQSLQSSTSAVNLLTNKALDYEDDDTYTITVQVTGTYGMTVQSFTISVTDVNEAPKNLALHNNVVQENINNAVVGIVTAEDPEGDDIDFDITEDPTNSFQLYTTGTRNSKRLVTKRVLDFENQPSMTVVIRAREIDSEGKTSSPLQFLVFVIDVNEPPSDISLNLNSVDENTPPGTIVSYIMVSDPDSDHHLQHFTCILRDDADGMFELQDLTLVVSSLGVLDYEGPGGTVLSIDIECWDQRGLSTERSFDITVNDVNERPTDIKSTSQLFQVKENQDIGEVIAYLTTDDPDEDDTFTYTVTPHTYFAIIADQLITHVHLNYEEKSTHEITLTSTDAEGLTVTKMVTVEVLDTNDPPTGILIPAGTAVNENSPINTLVAELTTIDEDSQQLFSYTLEAQNPQNALKLVDGNKLKVDDGSVINHEKIKALEVTIITRDNGRPTSFTHVETLIIPVLDVNEPPRSITLASDTVVEGSFEGTLIGEIYVDDPDSQNQAFLCTMANNDGNRFELEHNGTVIRLRVGSGFAIDYERVKYHDLILECHDSDLQSPVTGSFRINVLNANDVPSGIFVIDADPSDTTVNPNRPDDDDDIYGSVITSSVATVMENATTGITIVAYVFVTDEDNQNTDMQRQEHFCQLISEATYHQFQAETTRRRRRQTDATGTDDSWSDEIPSQFMIQSGTNSILVREELNYEDKDEYMIYLECADNGNPAMSTVRSVKIAVLDVDEAPIDIGLSSTSVVENSPEDTHIAHIGLVDPDDTRTAYAYEIISLGVPFYIEETELKISRTPIDHEITPVWTVQIRVIEVNTDLEIIKNFDIDIEPQNEAPDSLTIDGTTAITIPETLTVGSVVGTLEATDPDEDDTEFTFSFFGDHDSHDFFGIEGDKVKLLQSVDAWDNDLYELTVQVTDVGGLSYVGKVTVRLTDVNKCKENDYCSVFAQCLHSVCSCLPGFVGNGFTCTDVDDCANNPCHPDNTIGDCQNGVGGVRNFTCNCKEGWLGPDCYREIDDCVNNTCSVVGTDKCVDRLNSYECRCKRGYTGDKCEVDVDDCAENRCLNGGQCIDAISGYKCECKEPFTGINCETDGTICLNVTCPNKGVCIPYSSGHNYACRCLEPFSPDCEGCMYGYGGKDCEPCKPPLTGVNCAVDGSICTPNPCFGHGICVPYLGSKYACICANNYTGAHCEMLNGLKIAQGTDGQNDKFPLNMVYIIIGVSAFLLLIILLICFVWNKRRRVLAQKRMSSHARVRYDPNHQKVEMGPEFQGMEIVQGSEVHDLENPTFFDFEEMMGPDTATSQGMDDEARARMASIANRPIQNPKNNIVSVKVTNDLRAEFNNQGARPRETEPSESRIVTDGRTMQLTSNKNNLGNFETRRLELEDDEDDLKKEELVVDLDHTSVAFQNPVYESAEPTLGGMPRRNSETEAQEKRKSAKNINTKNSVRDLARKFQTPDSGIQSSQQLTKDNPVYESDEEEDSNQDKQ